MERVGKHERLQAARKSELPEQALHAQIRWIREKRKEERRADALKPRAERGRIADAPPLLLPPPRHSLTLLPSHINASEGGELGSHTSPGPYTKNSLIFDPAKFEAIHFSRRRTTPKPAY